MLIATPFPLLQTPKVLINIALACLTILYSLLAKYYSSGFVADLTVALAVFCAIGTAGLAIHEVTQQAQQLEMHTNPPQDSQTYTNVHVRPPNSESVLRILMFYITVRHFQDAITATATSFVHTFMHFMHQMSALLQAVFGLWATAAEPDMHLGEGIV